MNPAPRLFPIPAEKPRCQGEDCASDPDTWPLHHMIRGGMHRSLCCSCIILSQPSLYCCHCFFLVTTPSTYDDGDKLMAPPAPTVTCQVCCKAVAHLPCLYPDPADAVVCVFVCPPCTAAQNGMRFTYAPRCGQPIDQCGARVLVLAARIALVKLRQHAAAARANAERLAREAADAREIANEARNVAYDLAKKESSPWIQPQPQSPENDLAASEEGGIEAEANVGEGLPVPLKAMPSLGTLTIGTGASAVPMALTEAKHAPSSSKSKPLLDLDLNENAVENEAEAVQAEPRPHQGLNSFNFTEVARAAAEAARASLLAPQTLKQLPGAKASSSTKMPRTRKPRTKRSPRTLQLFNGDKKDM